MQEARLRSTEHGLVPDGEGWFVVNVRDLAWETIPGNGTWCGFEAPDAPSEQLGIGIHVLMPGEPSAKYHAESAQEGFLVLDGECVAVVEGEERRMRRWDYLHCPPGTAHITVGAGDGPCAILMVGTRFPGVKIHYPVSELAARYGASVAEATDVAREAYAGQPPIKPARAPWPGSSAGGWRSCAVELAALRAEPHDDAEQVTQAVLGEPLRMEDERDGWARVRTVYDYPGWIRVDQLRGNPLEEARRFVGVPYEWGGLSERGLDCSGLVHVAYRRAGRVVPRDADEQELAGVAVEEGELRPGDLVSYGPPEGPADHVAFWLGDGRILHATGRDGAGAVVEEPEPDALRARRRRSFRL